MGKSKKRKPPMARSLGAIAAHFRSGAGAHGGGKRRKNRRERQAARKELRDGIE